VVRAVEAQKAAEKQAEEAEVSARIHEARAALAHRQADAGAEDSPPVSEKRKKGRPRRRDLTLLLLFGVTAAAGLLYWLSQRPPTRSKAEPAPPPSAGAPAKPAPAMAPPKKAASENPPG
jgi:hypothetical protein